jgi:acetamidase/formamidase
MTSTTALSNHLGRDVAHHAWDRQLPPALTVASGDEMSLALRDGSNGQIVSSTVAPELNDLQMGLMDPLTGPIWVEGAQPGDVIAVEILDIDLAATGWSAILPGLGLLTETFPGPYVRSWTLDGPTVDIGDGHLFSLLPMLGVVGVAPPEFGQHPTVVPTNAGGNIDVKYVGVGSRLLLPVFTEGALLSLGDAHALQGDGELSGTAIECEADVTVRVELLAGLAYDAPVVETAPLEVRESESYRSFLGVGPDLYVAAQEASLRAVDALAAALHLEAFEAYALLGTIAELRIHEVVDRPNWVVGCMVPQRLFR